MHAGKVTAACRDLSRYWMSFSLMRVLAGTFFNSVREINLSDSFCLRIFGLMAQPPIYGVTLRTWLWLPAGAPGGEGAEEKVVEGGDEAGVLPVLQRVDSIEKNFGLSLDLKNHSRSQFQSVTCLNYPILEFYQYK